MTTSTDNPLLPITSPFFDNAEIDLVSKVLDSGWVTQGPMTRQFEKLMTKTHNVNFALATTSCTAALHLATMALELDPEAEVIVPAFTWVTSAYCAEYVGAKVVFVDVDLNTYNIDPVTIEAAITSKTKAIIVVHLFGLAAPMDEILEIANRYGIPVIEDAACAIGTLYRGRPVGGIGAIGCFSFHPRKVITTGEGGMVTTQDSRLATRIGALRNHGSTGLPASDPQAKHAYTMGLFELLGFNLRLSDIQAAVGVAQFAKLESLLVERRGRANRYNKFLEAEARLAIPSVGDCEGHSYQSYVVRIRDGGRDFRNEIMDKLTLANIQTRPGTHAVHRLGYFSKKYDLKADLFPNACIAEDSTITLPIFPGMSDSQQDFIIEKLISAL